MMWGKSSFKIPVLAVISFSIIVSTTSAYADLGDQVFKLLPSDGWFEDFFGVSVAISGTTAIVGAHMHYPSGSAYLFDTTTGQQLFELQDKDSPETAYFGWSVAISGTTAIVGAWRWFNTFNGDLSGSAYLFDISDPANPTQLFMLLANDGAHGDRFGTSVAINGTTAIVGAFFDDDNGGNSGSAYLFDTTTGRQIAKLLPDDGAADDFFGGSVAINSTTAIVGASGDDDNGDLSGSAYLFDISDPANPTQLFMLLANDGANGDRFGWSVAISGTTAIVGAFYDDDNGTDSGSAFLFDTTTGRQIVKLLPADGAAGDRFGTSVAINGTTAIVGASGDDDNGTGSGSVYLLDISDPTNPTQIAKLLPNDGDMGDGFGFSVAISGASGKEVAIVGAPFDQDKAPNSGSAYLFDAAAPGMCPWDLDDNAVVGLSDLLSLLADWGPCKGCPADFDGSGDVGVSDLLALLANWGPCP